MLSLLSGVVGVVVAASAIGALRSLAPLAIPRLHEIGLNLPVLGFTFALSLFTGMVFGLAPAVRALGRDLQSGLKEGGRGAAGGVGIRSTRGILVLAEVALAFMLLIGAALLLRSFDRLQRVDPGFKSDGVFTATVALPRAQYAEPAAQTAFADLLLERIQAVPGVRAAALSSDPPLGGSPPFWSFTIAGVEPPPPGVVQDAVVFMTSPEYFQTAEIPLVAGAVYGAEHRADGSPVAVVSQALAQRYWPGRSAVGQRITLGDPADSAGWMTVIGVVGDVRNEELGRPTYPQLYLPIAQAPVPSMVVLARTAGDPLELAGTVKRALAELDADLPLSEVATLDQRVADTLARPRVNAALLTAFAAVALLLAAVGIYGVIAFGVVQRTRELGIRMALGAGTDRLLRLVVHQGMRPVLAGIVLGLVGALVGGRLLRGLLFGVGATDPVTFLAVTAFLLVVAFARELSARSAGGTVGPHDRAPERVTMELATPRPPLRHPLAAEEPGARRFGRADARALHRRHDRDLQRGLQRAVPAAAVCRSRRAAAGAHDLEGDDELVLGGELGGRQAGSSAASSTSCRRTPRTSTSPARTRRRT